ncbi:MAG TPA: hypothetical protein VII63_13195 [Caulobacteraceae bacterium]
MIARTVVAVAACLWLGGCAAGTGSYGLGQGDANYDALAKATTECSAKGGEISLRNGYDGRELSSYECRTGKPR